MVQAKVSGTSAVTPLGQGPGSFMYRPHSLCGEENSPSYGWIALSQKEKRRNERANSLPQGPEAL